ncbi:SAM-dependent methyltransferase [bacterium]|nr:MAG: SAM-dependent methyltransferase [bacterium]
MPGTLYLIPTPIGKSALDKSIPPYNLEVIHSIRFFAVESIKTSIQFLLSIKHPVPEFELEFVEVSKRNNSSDVEMDIINRLLGGEDVGLMSEAGCPGVADPGAGVIALAHHTGVKVSPLIGPASMILALMASGFNGQKFRFNGYLGRDHQARNEQLRKLEQDSLQFDQTELFMESPQRNLTLLKDAIQVLQNETRLMVACNLSSPDELIISQSVSVWKRTKLPDIEKKPTIFGIWGESAYKVQNPAKSKQATVKRW